MPTPPKDLKRLESLEKIVDILLSPEGCPWDKEQTPQTLAPFVLEEAFELAEALEKNDLPHIKEELGDFLFQVILQAAIAQRLGQFTLIDVIEGIASKIVRRHPHVFGDVKVKDSTEVLSNWEKIKRAEKAGTAAAPKPGAFSIPINLPSLQRAQKIGEKCKKLGFDWDTAAAVFGKVEEEMDELREELKKYKVFSAKDAKAKLSPQAKKVIGNEIGDMFFSLAQLTRHLGLEAETVSRGANRKFEDRFQKTVELSKRDLEGFAVLGANKKERLWEMAKSLEKKPKSAKKV